MSIVLSVGPEHVRLSTGAYGRTPHYSTLADFIRRIAAKAQGYRQKEITVLISATIAASLGFPPTIHGSTEFLEPVRTLGFRVTRELFPFLAFHSHPELPDVLLGVGPWIEQMDRRGVKRKNFPLYFPDDIQGSIRLMAKWQDETGLAYRGRPGTNAIALLHSLHDKKSNLCPTWKPRDQPDIPMVTDPPFTPYSWAAEDRTPEELTAMDVAYYDANSAYLGRYNSEPLARWGLRHTPDVTEPWVTDDLGKRTPLAGWFLIQPQPWVHEHLPHPAGPDVFPNEHGEYEPVWRTAPTLELLRKLTATGRYGGYTILDSYTSKAYVDLQPMGNVLKEIIFSKDHAAPLIVHAKAAAQELHGQLSTEGGMITRPDWYATIRASARVTLWRKAYNTGKDTGKWPLYFKIDAAYYRPADLPRHPQFAVRPGLGGFKINTRTAGEKL